MIVLQSGAEAVERLTFTPDGRGLIVPQWGALQRWDDVTAGLPPVLETGRQGTLFAQFTADGRAMAFGGAPAVVRDVATSREAVLQFREPFSGWQTMVAVSPDGRHLLAAQWGWNTTPRGRLTCRAMAAPDVDVWSVDVDRRFQSRPLFLPDGNRFVTIECWTGIGSDFGPRFVTRDLLTGEQLAVFQQANRDRDRPCEFPVSSADRRWIAARNAGRLAVYQSEDLSARPRLIKNEGRKHFTGIAFHPSGRYLAATSNDATVKFYDTSTWEVARTFTWNVGRMRSIAFSPDGALAAAGSDTGKVVVWDVDL
jgi:WD40 repeat protein